VAYQWMLFGRQVQAAALTELRRTLRRGGFGFVTGPAALSEQWKEAGFDVVWQERVEQLPTFRMHRTILPKSRLQNELTLFFVKAG
jgi:hypothetical protein